MTISARLAVLAALAAVFAAPVHPFAQTDLDAFMERVIARRDDNWKKLQQYVLDERETFKLSGPAGTPLYGFDRDYTWFIRQGYFVRSPLKADGVRVSEADRAKYEAEWIERERGRERRKRTEVTVGTGGVRVDRPSEKQADAGPQANTPPPAGAPATVEDILKQSVEPKFVSAAYFLRFKFDPGHYALAGREQLSGREVLKVEYYPSKLFTEGRARPNKRIRDEDDEIEEKMNKVSLITLWIDPAEHQIIQYTFENIDFDFLPGRSIVRVDDVRAAMRMAQPFPGVWLPDTVSMQVRMTTAIGSVDGRYDVKYHDYRVAEVTTRIKGGHE